MARRFLNDPEGSRLPAVDGVGLRVGSPPQVVLVYRVETGANLPGKLVEHALPDHLQKLSIEGCVVHRAQ